MSCGCGGTAPPWLSPTPDTEPQIETNAFTPICDPATSQQIGWVFNVHDENAGTDSPRFFDMAFGPMTAPGSYVACITLDYEFFEQCWRDVDDHIIQHTRLSVVVNGDVAGATVVWMLSDGTVTTVAPTNIEPCPVDVPVQWMWREACDLDTGQKVFWKEGCDANGGIVYPGGAAAPIYYGCVTTSGSASDNGCIVVTRPGFVATPTGAQGIRVVSDNGLNFIKVEGFDPAEVTTMSDALNDGCILVLEASGTNGESATMVAGGPGWDGNLPGNSGDGGWFCQMDFTLLGDVCPDEVQALYSQFVPVADDFVWSQIEVGIHCLEEQTAVGGPLDPQPTNVDCCPEIAWDWREVCDLDTGRTVHYVEGIDGSGNPVYPNGAAAPVYYGCITSNVGADGSAGGCTVVERPGFVATPTGAQGIRVVSDNGLNFIKVEGFDPAEVTTMSDALNEGCILVLTASGTGGESATMVAGGPGWDNNLPGNSGDGGWFCQMDFTLLGDVCPDEVQALYSQFVPAPDDFVWSQIEVGIHCLEELAVFDGSLDPQPTNVDCCSALKLAETGIEFSHLVEMLGVGAVAPAGVLGVVPAQTVSLAVFNMTGTRVVMTIGFDTFVVPPGAEHTVNVVRDGAGLLESYLPSGNISYQFLGDVGDGVGNDPPSLIVNLKVHL